MTRPLSLIEQARHDAQGLHKKISANIAHAEAATWADVKAVQADTLALAARMKAMAEDQADAAKAGIKAAIGKMEEAGKMVETKAGDAKAAVKHANANLLESAHTAARSLSEAVADMRTKAAKAIAPKAKAKEVAE